MEIEQLNPNKITPDYKVIDRSITNFYVIRFNVLNEFSESKFYFGSAIINCQERILYKNSCDCIFEDLINVERQIWVCRDDKLTYYRDLDQFTWSPYLEKRFEALYFEGII